MKQANLATSLLAASLLAAGWAAPASAATMTFTGAITSDNEYNAQSGFTMNQLVGEQYTLTFTGIAYDSAGGADACGGSAPVYYCNSGNPAPIVDATLTFGGNTLTVPGQQFSLVSAYAWNPWGTGIFYTRAAQVQYHNADGSGLSIYAYGNVEPNSTSGMVEGYYAASADSFVSFNGGVNSISPGASAVPEPSTWAMMFLGFAAMGFAGFRRNKVARIAV